MRIKQGQPGTGFTDINRRRPSESVFPDFRAVRQRVRHLQPTPEELEAAHQANPRAVRDLNAWYDRLNELFDYSSINGNSSVPQLDPYKNPYPLGTSHPFAFASQERSAATHAFVSLGFT
jgi:hypothetical protein